MYAYIMKIYTPACMHTCKYKHDTLTTCIHIHLHICTKAHTHTQTRQYINKEVLAYTYKHPYKHPITYIHTDTHTDTQILYSWSELLTFFSIQ